MSQTPKRLFKIFPLPLWAWGLLLFGAFAWIQSYFQPGCGSPVSRAKADMRSMETALEAYFADHQSYPAMRPLKSMAPDQLGYLEKAGGMNLFAIEPGTGSLHGLTTPISYITSVYISEPCWPASPWKRKWPFRWFGETFVGWEWNKPGAWPYAYYNDRNLGWMLWARGPDGVFDITRPESIYKAEEPMPGPELVNLRYDPTNGLESPGDIWRIRGGAHTMPTPMTHPSPRPSARAPDREDDNPGGR